MAIRKQHPLIRHLVAEVEVESVYADVGSVVGGSLVLQQRGLVRPHAGGQAEIYVLRAAEGGRHTPFQSGYRPQFFFGATDVTGPLEIPSGEDSTATPGERLRVRFELDREIGLEPGMRFALCEGKKTVGASS